jgi:hypothetical protein
MAEIEEKRAIASMVREILSRRLTINRERALFGRTTDFDVGNKSGVSGGEDPRINGAGSW